MAEGSRPRMEANVSFAALSGSSFSAPGVSPWNTMSRMDWSSSATAVDGRGRSATGRSRNQASVRADSFRRSEGRRMSLDTRRYMQAAAASTQTTVQQLLTRLQAYKTFQPLMAHHGPYTAQGDEGGGGALQQQRGSEHPAAPPQLWRMMNELLDTSVSHLLQHNAEDHFIVTLQSTLGRELTTTLPKVRTVIDSKGQTPGGGSAAAAATAAGDRRPGEREAADVLVDRWALEHPTATAEEVQRQREAWRGFDSRRKDESRLFYLMAMQDQLDALQAEQRDAAAAASPGLLQLGESRSRLPISHGGSLRDMWNSSGSSGRLLDSPHSPGALSSAEEAQRETERQRALWLSFQDKTAAPTHAGSQTSAGLPLPPDAPRIVTAYLNSDEVHHWLHSSWPHRTHRHESAALRLQCAFRAYRARCEVRRRRYTRRQALVVGLAAEAEARRVWDIALQVQADASKAVSSGDGTMKALQFFIDKVNAVVAKRRARRRVAQLQEAEVAAYAALSIQRVYRGHRARLAVEELRHPEIVEARVRAHEERSAVVIQTAWRRHREQQRWQRVRRAACVLQRCFRCRQARRLLAERRRAHAVAEAEELRHFAVRRIERWFAGRLAVRNALAAAHAGELRTLQRVGRGYAQRNALGVQRHVNALRAAVVAISWRRRAVLQRRAAQAELARRQEEETLRRSTAVREDAAVTVQRAWRRYRAAVEAAELTRELCDSG